MRVISRRALRLGVASLWLLLAGAVPAVAAVGATTHHRHRRHHHALLHGHRRPAAPRRAAHPPVRRGARSAAVCSGARTTATAADLAAIRAAVLCLVNAKRANFGLPALREDGRLDRSAQGWSAMLVSSGQFTHGSDFAARISASGFDWSAAGENIATGYPTPAAVVAGWLASPGHCRNLLSPGFSAIGIGMVAAAVRGYASGPATWTQDFALPMGAPVPSGNGGPAAGCPYS